MSIACCRATSAARSRRSRAQKTGVEFVDYGEVGFRHILSKRKVTNLDELKGLKIRTPEIKLWVDFWKKLGANPTPLAYAEQYSALSTGLIDGLEADVFSIKGFKWGEQAKNLTSRRTGSCRRRRASTRAGSTRSRPTCRSWCATPPRRCSPSSARSTAPIPRRRWTS